MIELIHVEKKYPLATPLRDVNTVIRDGDVISVIGPSGTGKSTLLRCINMLDPPTAGQILVDGQDITDPHCDIRLVRRKIGMVFQSFNLFGHMTVIENIMTPQIDLLGKSRQEAFDRGMALLKKVGMNTRYLQYPEQLSGGQKQRVAIARTLAMDPKIILFDEPTSALDPLMVGEVQSVIRDLADSGLTMMIVTHEMKFARQICSRVFYMDQGGVYEDGSPEQVFGHPTRERTRAFIQRMKVFRCKFKNGEFNAELFRSNLNTFAENNSIPPEKFLAVQNLLLEMTGSFLFECLEQGTPVNMIVEFSEETGALKTLFYCCSSVEKTEENTQKLKAAFERLGGEASVERIEDGDYNLKASCTI